LIFYENYSYAASSQENRRNQIETQVEPALYSQVGLDSDNVIVQKHVGRILKLFLLVEGSDRLLAVDGSLKLGEDWRLGD